VSIWFENWKKAYQLRTEQNYLKVIPFNVTPYRGLNVSFSEKGGTFSSKVATPVGVKDTLRTSERKSKLINLLS